MSPFMATVSSSLPWPIRSCERGACARLAAEAGVPEAVAALLLNRDITSPEAARAFLHPSLSDLPAPSLMQDMTKAVELVAVAVREGRPIVIYGDYDVDGLTGSAVLSLFLRRAGVTVQALQPDRLRDGYGLHAHLLAEVRKAMPPEAMPLLITVDCGITSHEAVAAARELGFTVIVTDHHQPEAELPAADAILNPHRPDCPFPFKDLAGVGVAFYLVMGLRSRLVAEGFWESPPNLKEYLDLVALGTVADMVELTAVNRVLVKAGLEVLTRRKRVGVASLGAVAGLSGAIRGDDIAYRLAPRLNAASRLGSAAAAFVLLTTEDQEEARLLAQELDHANRRRRELGDTLYDAVQPRAKAAVAAGKGILIFADEGWHPGVLGIVATRLTREFHRPALVFAIRDGVAKGSGRSVEGVDLLGMLACAAGTLQGYGGHPMALGATLAVEDLPEFVATMEGVAAMVRPAVAPLLTVELLPSGKELNELIAWYPQLEPFGVGNPEPILAGQGVPHNVRVVGGRHARFQWPLSGQHHEAILFNRIVEQQPGNGQAATPVSFAFSLRRNAFQGRESWQLHGHDISSQPPDF